MRDRLLAHQQVSTVYGYGELGHGGARDRSRALASLLVKNPAQRARFDDLYALHFGADEGLPAPRPVLPWHERATKPREGLQSGARRLRMTLAALVNAALVGVQALWLVSVLPARRVGEPIIVQPNPPTADIRPALQPAPLQADERTAEALLEAFLATARRAPGLAPTLRELHRQGWPDSTLHPIPFARLVPVTGLDPDQPIVLLAPTRSGACCRGCSAPCCRAPSRSVQKL